MIDEWKVNTTGSLKGVYIIFMMNDFWRSVTFLKNAEGGRYLFSQNENSLIAPQKLKLLSVNYLSK